MATSWVRTAALLMAVAAASAAPSINSSAIVLYDGGLVADGFDAPVSTSWLPVHRNNNNALEAVTAALAAAAPRSISTIALVGHGAPGTLQLGGAAIDADVVTTQAAALRTWAAATAPDAEVQLHGCETGRGVRGAALLAALANATGLRVVAATAVLRGGYPASWRLDAVAASSADSLRRRQNSNAAVTRAVAAAAWRVTALAQRVVDVNYTTLNFTTVSLISGTDMATGALYRYTNVVKIGGVTVNAILNITDQRGLKEPVLDTNANPTDFEPTTKFNAGGGYADFSFTFQDASNAAPVSLLGFVMTWFDLDGSSAVIREYVDVGGFSAVVLDAATIKKKKK